MNFFKKRSRGSKSSLTGGSSEGLADNANNNNDSASKASANATKFSKLEPILSEGQSQSDAQQGYDTSSLENNSPVAQQSFTFSPKNVIKGQWNHNAINRPPTPDFPPTPREKDEEERMRQPQPKQAKTSQQPQPKPQRRSWTMADMIEQSGSNIDDKNANDNSHSGGLNSILYPTPPSLSMRGYRVLDRVSASTSAVISKVRDDVTQDVFVCKSLSLSTLATNKLRLAAEQEVQILRNLQHPNIIGYRDSFLVDESTVQKEYEDEDDLDKSIISVRKNLNNNDNDQDINEDGTSSQISKKNNLGSTITGKSTSKNSQQQNSIFSIGPQLVIIMQYASDGDLRDKMLQAKNDQKRIPSGILASWFRQTLLALEYIHNQKLVHRDLKSANIFLNKDYTTNQSKILVGDFGISKVLESTLFATTCIGTPAYMAPEIVLNKPYTSSVDIWAFGIICYELILLELPFKADSLMGLVYQISNEQVRLPPGGIGSGPAEGESVRTAPIHRCWREMISRCLTKEGGLRPSASALLRDTELLREEFCNNNGSGSDVVQVQLNKRSKKSQQGSLTSGSLDPGSGTNMSDIQIKTINSISSAPLKTELNMNDLEFPKYNTNTNTNQTPLSQAISAVSTGSILHSPKRVKHDNSTNSANTNTNTNTFFQNSLKDSIFNQAKQAANSTTVKNMHKALAQVPGMSQQFSSGPRFGGNYNTDQQQQQQSHSQSQQSSLPKLIQSYNNAASVQQQQFQVSQSSSFYYGMATASTGGNNNNNNIIIPDMSAMPLPDELLQSSSESESNANGKSKGSKTAAASNSSVYKYVQDMEKLERGLQGNFSSSTASGGNDYGGGYNSSSSNNNPYRENHPQNPLKNRDIDIKPRRPKVSEFEDFHQVNFLPDSTTKVPQYLQKKNSEGQYGPGSGGLLKNNTGQGGVVSNTAIIPGSVAAQNNGSESQQQTQQQHQQPPQLTSWASSTVGEGFHLKKTAKQLRQGNTAAIRDSGLSMINSRPQSFIPNENTNSFLALYQAGNNMRTVNSTKSKISNSNSNNSMTSLQSVEEALLNPRLPTGNWGMVNSSQIQRNSNDNKDSEDNDYDLGPGHDVNDQQLNFKLQRPKPPSEVANQNSVWLDGTEMHQGIKKGLEWSKSQSQQQSGSGTTQTQSQSSDVNESTLQQQGLQAVNRTPLLGTTNSTFQYLNPHGSASNQFHGHFPNQNLVNFHNPTNVLNANDSNQLTGKPIVVNSTTSVPNIAGIGAASLRQQQQQIYQQSQQQQQQSMNLQFNNQTSSNQNLTNNNGQNSPSRSTVPFLTSGKAPSAFGGFTTSHTGAQKNPPWCQNQFNQNIAENMRQGLGLGLESQDTNTNRSQSPIRGQLQLSGSGFYRDKSRERLNGGENRNQSTTANPLGHLSQPRVRKNLPLSESDSPINTIKSGAFGGNSIQDRSDNLMMQNLNSLLNPNEGEDPNNPSPTAATRKQMMASLQLEDDFHPDQLFSPSFKKLMEEEERKEKRSGVGPGAPPHHHHYNVETRVRTPEGPEHYNNSTMKETVTSVTVSNKKNRGSAAPDLPALPKFSD